MAFQVWDGNYSENPLWTPSLNGLSAWKQRGATENLQDTEIVAGIVQQRTDTFRDIIHIRRNLWRELDCDVFGIKPYPEMSHQFNGRRRPLKTPTPLLGEHN